MQKRPAALACLFFRLMSIDLLGHVKTLRALCPVVTALLCSWPSAGWAHKVTAAKLIVSIDTVARTYELQAAMDVAPSEDAILNEEISPETAARQFAEEYLTVLIDETKQSPELKIEVAAISDAETPAELQRHQVVTTQQGNFSDTAEKLLFYLDNRCPMAVVMVVMEDQKPSRRMQVILPGEYSRPLELARLTVGNPFELSADEPSKNQELGGAMAPTGTAPEGKAGQSAWWLAGAAVLLVGLSLGARLALRGRRNRSEGTSN
jgi:hypothetical protein